MAITDNAIERDIFLAFVRVHILHHATEGPVFGLEMIEELRRHGYTMSPGTLYPILHALEKSGYLRVSSKVVGGKLRKYYNATAHGKRILGRLKIRIRELVDEVLG
jgi:PadR family transcriptional regulator, regulatory protein PadR